MENKTLEERVKRELDVVYITSAGTRHLKKKEAIVQESQIQISRQARRRVKKNIMDIIDIILNTLKDNNWGIYYKSKPLQTLQIQDGSPLLKVNEVDEELIENAVEEEITTKRDEWTKSSQINSSQNQS